MILIGSRTRADASLADLLDARPDLAACLPLATVLAKVGVDDA